MTHDHAEDFALCDAALRCAHLGSVGLIGSAAKWQRFRRGLLVEGHAEALVDRIRTPIGGPGRPARNPATIAVRVAAELCDASSPRPGARLGAPVTIFRARALDTPDDPFAGGALRAEDDAGLLVVDGVIVARGSSPRSAAEHPDARRGRPARRRAAARPGRHPRALPAGARHRCARHAAAGVARQCALPEEVPAGRPPTTPARWPRSSASGWSRPAPPPRWSSAPTSPRPSTRCSPRRPGSGCGSPAGWWSATAACPTPLLTTPAARLRRVGRPGRPVARRRPEPVRRHPAVLPLRGRADPRGLRRGAREGARGAVHLARQREPGRGRRGGRAVPRLRATTSTPTTGTACWRPARCWPTTCTPTDAELAVLAAPRHRGRALPHEQLGPGQRPVPAAPPCRGRGAGRARLRRRRRHRLLAASRRASRPTSCSGCSVPTGLPLTPTHLLTWPPGPARWPSGSATRSATSASAGSSTPSVSGPARRTRSTSACGTRPAAEEALGKIFALAGDSDVADVWIDGWQPRRPEASSAPTFANQASAPRAATNEQAS